MRLPLFKPAILAVAMTTLAACNATTGGVAGDSAVNPAVASAPNSQDPKAPELYTFQGQPKDSLDEWFGAPALERKEGDATILQYRTEAMGGACVLIAVLYEARGIDPAIRHLSVRQGRDEVKDPAWCLSRLVRAKERDRTS